MSHQLFPPLNQDQANDWLLNSPGNANNATDDSISLDTFCKL
ncbi:hypothetical protein SAMN06272755_3174 [Picosynechococcus sp. OG1]|nr:hypothetical protein SAMN06272755_3174 [Picosynechococcus sp. OG1]SMQ86421.1 hypothetical protein SAMN06272774_3165 [Synechococcus sp. 7002]